MTDAAAGARRAWAAPGTAPGRFLGTHRPIAMRGGSGGDASERSPKCSVAVSRSAGEPARKHGSILERRERGQGSSAL